MVLGVGTLAWCSGERELSALCGVVCSQCGMWPGGLQPWAIHKLDSPGLEHPWQLKTEVLQGRLEVS